VSYDALVIAAHPDDAETQMSATLARLTDAGQRVLLVDLTDGERTEFAEPGVRAKQAHEAARILGVERCTLGLRDRLLQDTADARLKVAHIIRQHRPRWVLWDGKTSVVIRRRVRRRGVARSKPGAIGYCLVLDAPSAEGSPFVASDAAARRCSTVRTPSAPIADAARRIR
jgi:GlcNAc-PI de-N-acetylase